MQLTVPAQPIPAEPAQGRRLRVLDTPAAKSREKSICACSFVLCSISPLQFRTAFPGSGATTVGWARPASVNLIKTIPTDTPVGQPNVDSALLRISAQVILDCVTLK